MTGVGRSLSSGPTLPVSGCRHPYATWRKSLWCGLGAVITLALAATNDGRLW